MVLKKAVVLGLLIVFLLVLPSNAYSVVLINEIMYNPSTAQGDDSDLEWIEIFNNGTQTINLENFTIKGNNFDDVNITAGGFVIVARELIDGSDSDLDSFEAYYGNNDGIWNSLDGNYNALSGSFSLTNSVDTINLSNGSSSIIASYDKDFGANGNGHTLEL